MPRSKTPSFTLELPLQVNASNTVKLGKRLEANRQIYNACLGEALRRLDLMRQSKAYQAALKFPKGKARNKAFDAVNDTFGFNADGLQKFAAQCQKESATLSVHTGSHDMQTTSLRAFKAVQDHAFRKKGRPKFKGYRQFNSVEGKTDACILFRADQDNNRLVIRWNGLVLPILLNRRDTQDYQFRALTEHRTKYVRILRKVIKGKDYWYAQLIQEGYAPKRAHRPVGNDVVGLDLGPSTIAAVSSTDAILESFCPKVVPPAASMRRMERQMDRSRRATNPDAYNSDGTYKKGIKIKTRSKVYLTLRGKKAEKERKLKAERKRAHGELANRVMAQGRVIKTEKISYKSWQKSWFGKSIGQRAPGLFVSILRRKAEAAGGCVTEFSTQKTRLSQVDHTTGQYTKKPLSQREHVFLDGQKVQRDLYAAYLARFVENDRLDISQCQKHWASVEPLLGCAVSSAHKEGASGFGFGLPHAVPGNMGNVRAACTSKRRRSVREVVDAVAAVQAKARADVRATKNAMLAAKNAYPPSGGP